MVTIPLPRSNNEVGSGTGVGVGLPKQVVQNGVIATLGLGVGDGLPVQPLTQNGVIAGDGDGDEVTQPIHGGFS
jgi:hypothetical protein